ncbi:MAG: DNA gyrase subunit A [Lentisphaeria bacterium]|nr:DNA gyrase subunit A [Lentisphaeria bacterium]
MDSTENRDIALNDVPAGIEDIMHSAYLQYSLSVNVGRAIPDVRDGLKPVHRRILYAMKQLGLTKGHAYTKCAKVVGEVIGNYHPHGDQAVYDTMVRMAQDFSMRRPLIDGQGNFGSIDGDSAAAYRYTECRLERLAEELLADMDRNTIDMRTTFDEVGSEPVVLPARFPNLLVNGSTGIGVGMATNIPPHNLAEVINATIMLIDNPMVTIREMMQALPGPDFPTGAALMGINPVIQLYETGHAVLKLRGKAVIEEKNERERIIVTEIPYAVNKERMVTSIADLIRDKRIVGISGLRDESSSRAGIRIVIDIKRNAMGNVVLNQLYKHTQLETSFGCQFLVVDRNRPRTMNLRQVLQAYIDHRLEVITRRTLFELEKAEARAHILEGLLIAVDNIDEVVDIIRKSRTRDEAANALMERFGLSDKQTAAILDMRLHQLTGLAMEAIQTEYDELTQRIAYYKELLASREMRMGVVKEELIEVRDKYAEPRRTRILPSEKELNVEDLIERGICVVTVSATGYIKRVPVDTYRIQGRGGKGVIGMQTKEEDYVEHLMTMCTHDYILFFTNQGRMHWLKGYEIPEAPRQSRGKALVNLIQLEPGEVVRAMITVDEVDVDDRYVIMATANGIVKKTALNMFKNLRRKGIIAIDLDEDDDLIEAKLTDGTQQILLSAANGMACRFRETDCRTMGRKTRGVRGMELRGSDKETLVTKIVAMNVADPEAELLVITANGMGMRTRVGTGLPREDGKGSDGYRMTRRGGKGIKSIRLKADDRVVSVLMLRNAEVEAGVDEEALEKAEHDILMTSVKGQMVRISTEGITPKGRGTMGVRVMSFKGKDEISSVSLVERMEEGEEPPAEDDDQPVVEAGAPVEAVSSEAGADEETMAEADDEQVDAVDEDTE